MGKTTFCCSLNSTILRTRGTTKTKMTLSTKQVFGVFCFQEQKTVLENTKQTGPKLHHGIKFHLQKQIQLKSAFVYQG